MYKLVTIKQFGFEIEMFVEYANAYHKFKTLAERASKAKPAIIAIFLYDEKDELIGATNIAVL